MSEIAEVEVLEPGTEMVPASVAPTSLFRTDDPAEVLTKAKATAEALAPVIRSAGLVSSIQGKDYLNVEAWQTLGQQVGVTPVVTSTRRLSDPDGWEARCEARTLDGRTIGAADSMCLRSEERWQSAEDFEIRSMAQTRAMSRALASVLRFIPTLAGFGGTPAEEMDRVKAQGGGGNGSSEPRKPSQRQLALVERLLGESRLTSEEANTAYSFASSTLTGGREGSISKAIDGLMNEKDETAQRLLAAAREWAATQGELPDSEVEIPPSDGDDIPF